MELSAQAEGVLVAHAMTEDVVVTHPETSLWDAVRALHDSEISGMPVIDRSNRLVGVLSEKDIARCVSQIAGRSKAPRLLGLLVSGRGRSVPNAGMAQELLLNTPVSEVMSRDPIVTSPDAPLDTAARIMLERRINRLPVVKGGKLVGILTRHDVLSALV